MDPYPVQDRNSMTHGAYDARNFQSMMETAYSTSHVGGPPHARHSGLGATVEQECQALLVQSDVKTKPAGDAQSRAARRLLRHDWQPTSTTALDIEAAVAQLLSDPAQAALAKRQFNNR